MVDSDDSNRPTPRARVPLDKVQGTTDVSRRPRRHPFRGLRPRAPLVVDSDDSNRPTPHARVPLDKVQGTTDVSRRPRRHPFRGLRPRAPLVVDSDGRNRPTRHRRAIDSDDSNRPIRHAPVFDSDDSNRPTPRARVPLDKVQGTTDVSRRIGTKPPAKLQEIKIQRQTTVASRHAPKPINPPTVHLSLDLLPHLLLRRTPPLALRSRRQRCTPAPDARRLRSTTHRTACVGHHDESCTPPGHG